MRLLKHWGACLARRQETTGAGRIQGFRKVREFFDCNSGKGGRLWDL